MSENENPQETAPDEADNEVIRALREQAKEGKAAKARAEALERELAFTKAGIDPDDPRQRYFVQGYQGELTADAIRAEATSTGFLPSEVTTSEPPQGITQEQRDAIAGISAAAQGPSDEPPTTDLYEPFRGASYMATHEDPQNFAMRLAQHLEANGEFVSYEGGQRKPARSA